MSGNTADILRVQPQDELIFTTPALGLASGDGRECRETRLFLGPSIYEPSLKIQVVKCFLESGKKLRELSVTVVGFQIYFDLNARPGGNLEELSPVLDILSPVRANQWGITSNPHSDLRAKPQDGDRSLRKWLREY